MMCTRKIVSEQKGAVAIMVAVSFIMLLGMAAFVIDFGYGWATTNELQNAADAGALAGVRALGKHYCPEIDPTKPCKDKAVQDDTTITEVETVIKDAVKDVVNQNKAANLSISIDVEKDIDIGTWGGEPKVFTPNATPPDAVRVRAHGAIKTFLGNIFRVPEISLLKPATAALTGVSQVAPGALDVPFGVSQQRNCDDPKITFHPSEKKVPSCAGWTGFFGDTNEPALESLITGTVQSPEIKIGDLLNWTGGDKTPVFNALYQHWLDECGGSPCPWEVYVPVYKGDCSTSIKVENEVVGFATMKITKVDCTQGGSKGCEPKSGNVIEGELTCKVEPGRGGGSNEWAIGSIPGLVQ